MCIKIGISVLEQQKDNEKDYTQSDAYIRNIEDGEINDLKIYEVDYIAVHYAVDKVSHGTGKDHGKANIERGILPLRLDLKEKDKDDHRKDQRYDYEEQTFPGKHRKSSSGIFKISEDEAILDQDKIRLVLEIYNGKILCQSVKKQAKNKDDKGYYIFLFVQGVFHRLNPGRNLLRQVFPYQSLLNRQSLRRSR